MTTPCSFPSVHCSFRVWNYSGQPFSPCALSPIGIGIQVGKSTDHLLRAVESRNAFFWELRVFLISLCQNLGPEDIGAFYAFVSKNKWGFRPV